MIYTGQRKIQRFEEIFSFLNLLEAWREFKCRKEKKEDVAEFALRLSDNLGSLHREIISGLYRHGGYVHFKIRDPKERDIHKASVRDRVLHHALYTALYPYFDQKFIFDSYSCRENKGTHKALQRFKKFAKKVSRGNTKTCWILKCDIRKFFASIDQKVLLSVIKKHIEDWQIMRLIENVVQSFNSGKDRIGLPLGNLTSQILVNIYMNEFDQWMKRVMKIKYFIRYADDFVIFDTDRNKLLELIPKISEFLEEKLKLELHPRKVSIGTLASGVDFLGWTHFPTRRILRTKTKRRMFKNLSLEVSELTRASYLGLLKHGNTYKMQKMLGFRK